MATELDGAARFRSARLHPSFGCSLLASMGAPVNAAERERSEESDVELSRSSSDSGVHDARLLPPRPRPRELPGKEVLPAPGVPETPRRERNQPSSFWPAPPEPMKVPPARPSKRG